MLANAVVMQWINEPFFTELRTNQQLGYVVATLSRVHRDLYANLFLIQSTGKSCEYLSKAINEFLIMKREEVKKLTQEEFDVPRKAVHTQLNERDMSLYKEADRHLNELENHKYLFDR